MEEIKEETTVPKEGEFDINNLETVRTANYLDLKYDDLTDNDVNQKLEVVWKNKPKDKPFSQYVRELNSELGYHPGIHPLDKIYSYLTLEEREITETKEKEVKTEKEGELRAKRKAILQRQKEIAEEKDLVTRKKMVIEREKRKAETEKEIFKQKVEAVRKLLKEI